MPSQASPDSQRISVAMIVRDEESVVADSLRSVRMLADEIVVLDTGSVDRTVEVARQQGARVITTRWRDDFAAARNELLDHVSGAWVLWMDAGEQLEPDGAPRLREFIATGAQSSLAYLLMVRQPSPGSPTSVQQATKLRLMPNRSDLWFEGRIRESLKPAMLAAGMDIAVAPGSIRRHPRHADPAERARRARRNRRLAAMEAGGDGRAQLRGWLAHGEADVELGEMSSARPLLENVIREAPRESIEALEAYYALLTTFDNDPDGRDRRTNLCLAALAQFPLDAQLLCAMGTYLQQQGQLELAARAYDAALKHGQIHAEAWHLADVGPTSAGCLALTLQLLGRHEQAAAELELALSCFPGSSDLRRQCVELKIKLGQPDDAVRLAAELAADPSQRESLGNAIRGACLAAAQRWLPALGSLQAAYVGGCRDPICLKWLSVTLMSSSQAALAAPVLEQWMRIEPENAEARAYLDAMAHQPKTAPHQPTTPHQPTAPHQPKTPHQFTAPHWLRLDGAEQLAEPLRPAATTPSHREST